MSWPWSQLGLPGPSDLSQVRRAYAEKLKTTHPEDDPEGFQRLHSAYQLARRMARQREEKPPPVPPPERPGRTKPCQPDQELPPAQESSRDFDFEELLQKDAPPPHQRQEEQQDFNFEELLQTDAPPPHQRQEEQDFDFEELLQKDAPPPHRRQEEQQDFDFEELLQTDAPPPHRKQEEQQDFDFEELLQKDAPPPHRRQEEQQDFDFERLFAEGEAERAEARRRRAQERRSVRERQRQERARQEQERRNTYEQERQSRFHQEQVRWQNTETILHTIEMMYSARAGAETWRKFFQSPLFQQSKGSLDLIFGLEDFVSTREDLTQKARMALFLAYGFDKDAGRPELGPLYRMLLPAWQAEQGENRRKTLKALWPYLAGCALVPVSLIILSSKWLLGFFLLGVLCLIGLCKGWLKRSPDRLSQKRKLGSVLLWLLALSAFTGVCIRLGWGLRFPLCILAVGAGYWVVREILHLGRQEQKARGMPRNKRDERWIVAITAVCLMMGASMLFMPELREGLSMLSLSEDPREQVCHYLELDYGIAFQSLYNRTELDRYGNVFAPKDNVGRQFLAGPDGRRVVREGRLGYTTNYTDMQVLWSLEDFAKAHGLPDVDLMNRNQKLADWETTGTYLIVLPFYGAGDVITDLGKLLEELAQEDWYQFQTPSFQVVLCSEQLAEGRLILREYQSSEGPFDAQGLRTLYEETFTQSFCAQILRECQLDRDFTGGNSAEVYTLVNGGMAELMGIPCCRLYGVDGEGQTAMDYYIDVSTDTMSNVYCIPGGFWEAGGNEEQIRFFRLIHREAGRGELYLYYPWPEAVF